MPLAKYHCDLLGRLTDAYNLGGRIGCLGRIWPSLITLKEGREALAPHSRFAPALADLPGDEGQVFNDKKLFRVLGFDSVSAIDFDDSEGAEIIHDLNIIGPDEEHRGYFDVIYNNGTMEHIFHTPNFLENIFLYLKEGGVVIHSAPINNQTEHGFYQFSPTLFYDFYTENRYDILECSIAEHHLLEREHKYYFRPFNTFDHAPDALCGKLTTYMHDVIFVARKGAETTANRIPTQFRYRNAGQPLHALTHSTGSSE